MKKTGYAKFGGGGGQGEGGNKVHDGRCASGI